MKNETIKLLKDLLNGWQIEQDRLVIMANETENSEIYAALLRMDKTIDNINRLISELENK